MATTDTMLGRDLLAHLDEQQRSLDRLHSALTAQAAAIRERDVTAALHHSGLIEVEATFRTSIEARRTALLRLGATTLGIPVHEVTLTHLCTLTAPDQADEARTRSDRLTATLEEIHRMHEVNRAMLRQELTFLEHLLSLGGLPTAATYQAPGTRARPAATSAVPGSPSPRALDLQA
ncbi:MAG: flagellar protein FlgN [Solirubrobacteraceae bacterium]|nr:flagellar protein FlgN [Solirubrobacteraceae bacterium]